MSRLNKNAVARIFRATELFESDFDRFLIDEGDRDE